jgi:adenine-specific DNA-methyltransferase
MGRYVTDFACLDAKLIVELDGGQHAEQQSYDEERTRFLQAQGFVVLRFWDHEVLGQLEAVLEQVLRTLPSGHPHPNPLPPAGEGLA